jgi:hypothetical protein
VSDAPVPADELEPAEEECAPPAPVTLVVDDMVVHTGGGFD